MKRDLPSLLVLSLLLAGCRTQGQAAHSAPEKESSPAAAPAVLKPRVPSAVPTQLEALRVEGARIVDAQGRPTTLRGVAFGNQVWSDVRIPRAHHDERDFERVVAMGMNSIRFYLNYRTFEADAAPGVHLQDGFDWLDQNVDWARRHGVYLVLNMHVPPGGYQSLGKGKALWSDPKEQRRFIDLWRAIAERYRHEPAVAGFDILNEPVVSESPSQWRDLAERTIQGIREVNPEHIVFVERLNAIDGDWKEDADRNFFRVSDPNVVYEFHFYKPFHFTHQSAPWVDFSAADQRYPDERLAEVEWFLLDWVKGTDGSPKLPAGDSPWSYYQGEAFTVDDPKLVVGKPTLACNRLGSGEVAFDDLVLERVDGKGAVERIWSEPLETRRGWYYWSADGSGGVSAVPAERTETGAAPPEAGSGARDVAQPSAGGSQLSSDGSLALRVTGSRGDANLGADYLRFVPRQGATYRLSGWMRGRAVPASAHCQIRLDFFSSKVPVTPRNEEFLKAELDAYVAWGKREGVPLYLGEWGAIKFAFEEDRGGVRWVSDMLDLLLEHDLSFAYHDYHEEFMGIYLGDGRLPDPERAQRDLIELFTSRLAGPGAGPTATPAPAPPSAAPPSAPTTAPAAAPPSGGSKLVP